MGFQIELEGTSEIALISEICLLKLAHPEECAHDMEPCAKVLERLRLLVGIMGLLREMIDHPLPVALRFVASEPSGGDATYDGVEVVAPRLRVVLEQAAVFEVGDGSLKPRHRQIRKEYAQRLVIYGLRQNRDDRQQFAAFLRKCGDGSFQDVVALLDEVEFAEVEQPAPLRVVLPEIEVPPVGHVVLH